MSDLGAYAEGFASWRKVIAAVPLPARKKIFENIARDVARYVKRGLDKSEGVDQLYDIAMANGLITECGEDHIQLIISDAFLEIEREAPDSVPNGKANGANGHDKTHAAPAKPLTFIDLPSWEGKAVPERRWVVKDCIPCRNVTLLSGEGGVGKTLLMQQLAVATVLGADWVGMMPEQAGPVILLSAEDDQDEIHFRMDKIVNHYRATVGATFASLADLHIISLAGQDAVLALAAPNGLVKSTPKFDQLVMSARMIRPRWIGIDTLADVFVCDERDRSQVRQCIGILRGLALEVDTAVVLLSHPSLAGIQTGTGLSGSTAWNNSVRSRLYLRKPKKGEVGAESEGDDKDDETAGGLILELMKANYGPSGNKRALIWREGMLVENRNDIQAMSPLEKEGIATRARDAFLSLLKQYNVGNQAVSHKFRAGNYAPKEFMVMPEGKLLHKRKDTREKLLADAMEYLMDNGEIHVAPNPKDKRSPCLYVGRKLL